MRRSLSVVVEGLPRFCCWMVIAACLTAGIGSGQAAEFHRLYDGVTWYVHNPDGKAFDLSLDVRDINIYENGAREVLLKVYDPSGQAVVRQVIPDDGVTSKAYLPPMGAWDHEAWYYAHQYMQGTQPMWRWSAPSQPDRLAVVPSRVFRHQVPAGPKGVYRVLVVGATDHYVSLGLTPELKHGLAGHPDWLHGHGTLWQKSYLYVPRGATGLHVMLAEFDMPRIRRAVLKAPDQTVLAEVTAAAGGNGNAITFESPGQFDDQVLSLEVSSGPDDFMVNVKYIFPKDPEVHQRGSRAIPAVLAPDEATARHLQGGAIYHDNRLFWQPYQVKLYNWLQAQPEEAFVVKNEAGEVLEPVPSARPVPRGTKAPGVLPQRAGFLPLNGVHWQPPLCDRIMYHWPAHKNRQALNLAIRDLAAGLRSVGPNDHVGVITGGSYANLAYEFGAYAWHYWRPAWRILQESDAPPEVKDALREAFLACGDRLAFCRSWERVNGNSYAQVLSALRYCYAATGDPLQEQLFDTYWQRFVSGGWGERVGIGPSGPVQEGFGYAYHYGSYILSTWQSVLGDFHDPRMQQAYDRIHTWFSYTLADERVPAGPWSTRTHHYPQWNIETEGPFAWKGLPGPDFTDAVNGANEWFAARRPTYYLLTYHGRLSPKWETNAHNGQAGYGGGLICQLQIPGHGPVLASTLNGDYGDKMHPSEWRTFHLHSVVGQLADGSPLVVADSEHLNAKLDGMQVSSSGEVRGAPVHGSRRYTYQPDGILCGVQLAETQFNDLLNLWVKNPQRGQVAQAYEMIPFQPLMATAPKGQKRGPTAVTLRSAEGQELGELKTEPTECQQITIDRGGFGLRIELDKPRRVLRGENNTVLIELAAQPTAASQIALEYRLVPFKPAE